MLIIHEKFTKKLATDPEIGNVNDFLLNLLIEVVTENYRQTLNEHIWENEDGSLEAFHLDPPLRANERIISGLFSQAISKASSRSRPEARINRKKAEIPTEEEFGSSNAAGRIDFLAWTNGRTIGIELKSGLMNFKSNIPTDSLLEKWKKVWQQAQDAQNYLRDQSKEDKVTYPSPITLALMVVVGVRNVIREDIDEIAKNFENDYIGFVNAIQQIGDPKPQFIATYTFPEEFRGVSRRKRGASKYDKEKCAYTPFVGFICRAAINKTQK